MDWLIVNYHHTGDETWDVVESEWKKPIPFLRIIRQWVPVAVGILNILIK